MEFIESDLDLSKGTFLTHKGKIDEMLSTVRILNEQMTNSYFENEIEEIIFRYNVEETLYKANISRHLGQIEGNWDNIRPAPKNRGRIFEFFTLQCDT